MAQSKPVISYPDDDEEQDGDGAGIDHADTGQESDSDRKQYGATPLPASARQAVNSTQQALVVSQSPRALTPATALRTDNGHNAANTALSERKDAGVYEMTVQNAVQPSLLYAQRIVVRSHSDQSLLPMPDPTSMMQAASASLEKFVNNVTSDPLSKPALTFRNFIFMFVSFLVGRLGFGVASVIVVFMVAFQDGEKMLRKARQRLLKASTGSHSAFRGPTVEEVPDSDDVQPSEDELAQRRADEVTSQIRQMLAQERASGVTEEEQKEAAEQRVQSAALELLRQQQEAHHHTVDGVTVFADLIRPDTELEESEEEIRMLFDKIDKDEDGMVTLEEIVAFGASETERRGGPRADPRANLEELVNKLRELEVPQVDDPTDAKMDFDEFFQLLLDCAEAARPKRRVKFGDAQPQQQQPKTAEQGGAPQGSAASSRSKNRRTSLGGTLETIQEDVEEETARALSSELGDLASPRYTFANSLPKPDATPALQDLPTHFPPHAYSDSEDSSSDDDSGDADHGSDGIAGEAYDSDEEAVQVARLDSRYWDVLHGPVDATTMLAGPLRNALSTPTGTRLTRALLPMVQPYQPVNEFLRRGILVTDISKGPSGAQRGRSIAGEEGSPAFMCLVFTHLIWSRHEADVRSAQSELQKQANDDSIAISGAPTTGTGLSAAQPSSVDATSLEAKYDPPKKTRARRLPLHLIDRVIRGGPGTSLPNPAAFSVVALEDLGAVRFDFVAGDKEEAAAWVAALAVYLESYKAEFARKIEALSREPGESDAKFVISDEGATGYEASRSARAGGYCRSCGIGSISSSLSKGSSVGPRQQAASPDVRADTSNSSSCLVQ